MDILNNLLKKGNLYFKGIYNIKHIPEMRNYEELRYYLLSAIIIVMPLASLPAEGTRLWIQSQGHYQLWPLSQHVLQSHVGSLFPKSYEADVEVGQMNTVHTGDVSQLRKPRLRKYQIVKSTVNKTAQTPPTGRHQLSILDNKPFCSLLYFVFQNCLLISSLTIILREVTQKHKTFTCVSFESSKIYVSFVIYIEVEESWRHE